MSLNFQMEYVIFIYQYLTAIMWFLSPFCYAVLLYAFPESKWQAPLNNRAVSFAYLDTDT